MDKERIVGSSPHWEEIKNIFHSMKMPISHSGTPERHESHGILIIANKEGLFLQMTHTYEYVCILHGYYSGVKLYHYLSLLTDMERDILLNKDPLEQWVNVHTYIKMPYKVYQKLKILQRYLPTLYDLIPIVKSSYLLTIPKGRASIGESSIDAAIREMKEETGIEISSDQLGKPYIDRTIGTDGHAYITYIYPCFVDERPQVTLGKGFKGYMWIGDDGHLVSERQHKMLQTFLYKSNETNYQRCRDCSWLQSKGSDRDSAYPEETTIECAHQGTDAGESDTDSQ